MNDSKTPSLGDVVVAWQELAKYFKTSPSDKEGIEIMLDDLGVLLQRLITELPQQAKTLSVLEAIRDAIYRPIRWHTSKEKKLEAIKELDDFDHLKWVALETVIGKQEEKKEVKR